eukprot:6947116-Pyramimonas_sp.AAC.1
MSREQWICIDFVSLSSGARGPRGRRGRLRRALSGAKAAAAPNGDKLKRAREANTERENAPQRLRRPVL